MYINCFTLEIRRNIVAKKKAVSKAAPWQAWVSVKWKPGAPKDAWKKWKSDNKMRAAWSTTGDWDCAIWVDAKSPDDVEKLVWDKIRKNSWVENTETHWIKQWW